MTGAKAAGAAGAAGDRPYGWLARIGVIAPSINTCIEPQFRALAPPGVEFHVTRLRLRSGDRSELLAMGDAAGAAAELLADLDPDLVLFQCTAATTIGGPAYEADLVARVAAAAGRPATSTGSAVVAALRTLGAERVALITPYEPEINEAEARFLDGHGLRVVEDRALGLEASEYTSVPPERWLDVARGSAAREADAVFLSCTNVRTLEVIEALERELGRPVVTSNQAGLWQALRLVGVDAPMPGAGRLLRLGLPGASPAGRQPAS